MARKQAPSTPNYVSLSDVEPGTVVEQLTMDLFSPGAPLRTTRYVVTGQTRLRSRVSHSGKVLAQLVEHELKPLRGRALVPRAGARSVWRPNSTSYVVVS